MTDVFSFIKFIMYVSLIFWLLPPIRQYKSKMFLFFLILAVSDPITLLITRVFQIIPNLIYIIISLAVYFSLFNFRTLNKKIYFFFFLLVTLGFGTSFFPNGYAEYYTIFLHFLILIFFLKRALVFAIENGVINIFHMILILYEVTTILKTLAFIENFSSGLYYYAWTNIFQILIALFFTVYREDNKKLWLDIRNSKIF